MCHTATDLPAGPSKLSPLWMGQKRLKIHLLFSSNTTRIHVSVQLVCYLLFYLGCTVKEEFVDKLCNLFQNQVD